MTKKENFGWLGGFVVLRLTDWLLADIPAAPIRRLDDPTRVKVLAAIAGLIILGFGMVLLAWLGARYAQHYRHGGTPLEPAQRPDEHDWAKRPMTPGETPPESRSPTPDL